MTDAMTMAVDTGPVNDAKKPPARPDATDEQLVGRLVEQARAKGLQSAGEGGLLRRLRKLVVESALDGEITNHLGYDKHDPAGKNGANSRGSQTYLWPSGTFVGVPGDMMIDGLTSRDGRPRPLSLTGPSAAPGVPAVTRSDKCKPGAGRGGNPIATAACRSTSTRAVIE